MTRRSVTSRLKGHLRSAYKRLPEGVRRRIRPGLLAARDRVRRTGLGRRWRWDRYGAESAVGPPPWHSHQVAADWQPAVAVVVTAHNDSRFLGWALTSLIDQDLGDFECIVVDDGSTDLTLDVAVAFAAADARFRVVQHEGDAGLPAARNTGLSYARAPWVTFLDADDFLWPSALSRRLDAVGDDPECAGAYCDWRAVPEDSSPRLRPSEARALPRATFAEAQWETPFIASAPVLRTATVRALGGFSETLHSAEDFEFYLRLLRAGYWISYARYVGVGYRQVPGSMIRANPALHFEVVRSVVDAVERDIDPAAIPGAVAPFTRPMSYYVRETKLLRRQLRFLALAHLSRARGAGRARARPAGAGPVPAPSPLRPGGGPLPVRRPAARAAGPRARRPAGRPAPAPRHDARAAAAQHRGHGHARGAPRRR